MVYAVKSADGTYTGAVYDVLTAAAVAHHAAFGETLEQVARLDMDDAGRWVATAATAADIAAKLTVSRFQMRAALLDAGLLDAATEAVAQASAMVRLAWDQSADFARGSASIAAICAALNLSGGEVDDLFIAASHISS